MVPTGWPFIVTSAPAGEELTDSEPRNGAAEGTTGSSRVSDPGFASLTARWTRGRRESFVMARPRGDKPTAGIASGAATEAGIASGAATEVGITSGSATDLAGAEL